MKEKKIKDEDSAFPVFEYFTGSGGRIVGSTKCQGLTKRELFAAMAMQAILSNEGFNKLPAPADHFNKSSTEMDCEMAIKYADTLLAELKKGTE